MDPLVLCCQTLRVRLFELALQLLELPVELGREGRGEGKTRRGEEERGGGEGRRSSRGGRREGKRRRRRRGGGEGEGRRRGEDKGKGKTEGKARRGTVFMGHFLLVEQCLLFGARANILQVLLDGIIALFPGHSFLWPLIACYSKYGGGGPGRSGHV